MADLERSENREVMIPFRMSKARRIELKERAAAQDTTVQALIERALWGDELALPEEQMELPMTG
ncbi:MULTISPECIES: hypothetical protein [Dermacoccus]|nr:MULTISPECIES: hypothetical protein [Dermacoccus]KLO61768.1 hypothetical protein AA983_13995 [Dermacoccus sp. PE3]MBE7372889.1 hypothetical protein [Dermacoccus barathri]